MSAWDDPIGRIRDLEAEVAALRDRPALVVGTHVQLELDHHDPKRSYLVVRVDDDGAWLTRSDPTGCPCPFCQPEPDGPWCIGATAPHAVVTESQGVLL